MYVCVYVCVFVVVCGPVVVYSCVCVFLTRLCTSSTRRPVAAGRVCARMCLTRLCACGAPVPYPAPVLASCPLNFQLIATEEHALRFSWEEPFSSGGVPILGYHLYYTREVLTAARQAPCSKRTRGGDDGVPLRRRAVDRCAQVKDFKSDIGKVKNRSVQKKACELKCGTERVLTIPDLDAGEEVKNIFIKAINRVGEGAPSADIPSAQTTEANLLSKLELELKLMWASRDTLVDTKLIQGIFQRIERRAYIVYLQDRIAVGDDMD